MTLFWVAFVVALVASSIGFKKYVWFISIGYGLAVAAIGVVLLMAGRDGLEAGTTFACALLVVYGLRLSGYLGFRGLRSGSYNAKMKREIKSGKGMPMAAKCGLWAACALLYAAETAPVTFRVANGSGADVLLCVGMVLSAFGLAVESMADTQKSVAKHKDPHRFVDTGLFRIVRCPNYFGEMVFWTGVFVGGIPIYQGILQWLVALLGYLGIVYVMFSGARRLEMRHRRTYGHDREYQHYARTTPIMIPLVPLYSVERHRWLVA